MGKTLFNLLLLKEHKSQLIHSILLKPDMGQQRCRMERGTTSGPRLTLILALFLLPAANDDDDLFWLLRLEESEDEDGLKVCCAPSKSLSLLQKL